MAAYIGGSQIEMSPSGGLVPTIPTFRGSKITPRGSDAIAGTAKLSGPIRLAEKDA